VLRLPIEAIGVFVNNEQALYAFAEQELSKTEKPLPQLTNVSSQEIYRVKSGDYLGKIAQRYGVSVSQIKRWNGLRSDNLRVGQRLTLNSGKPAAANVSTSASGTSSKRPTNAPKEYTVREGDSLWTISRKYPGITIEDIKKWNGMRSDNLTPGTRLKLCSCSP
jgi:membrane-bound lytic murein transglycosylase D